MRAVVVDDFGAEPRLAELADPVPDAGDIVVRMHAAALNPFDWKVIDGALRGAVEHHFPLTLGSDGAGVVTEVGNGVTRFRAGDRVYGQFLKVSRGRGSFSQYAVVADKAAKLAKLPADVPFEVAASLPTASTAAYQAVLAAGLTAGDVVLVNGASGGVGQSAVQFAAEMGAKVLATAPPDLAEHMRGLGAAAVIDFTAGPTVDQVRAGQPDGVAAVIDLVSRGGDAAAVAGLVRAGGAYVSTNNAAESETLAARKVHGVNLNSRVTAADLEALAERVADGRLRVQFDECVSLDAAPAAIAHARAGHARGQTVILFD
jgi:NADPH:quinone reductase-like Zn-dependent oxidoreductase